MNREALQRVLDALAPRDGLRDDRYLVGRDVDLQKLLACVQGLSGRSVGWIYGPRRIGKTTLAKILMERARKNNTEVLFADAIDLPGDLDALLNRWMKTPNGSDTRQRFATMIGRSDRQILAVVDEMDRLALSFSFREQHYLRRLRSEHENLAYLFVTSLPPTRIVEHLEDALSRLLGIFTPTFLRMLRLRDVHELCRRITEDTDLPEAVLDPNWLWQYIGGIPVMITSAIREILLKHLDEGPLSPEQREDILRGLEREFSPDLERVWNDLHAETRAVLRGEQQSTNHTDILRDDGVLEANSVIPHIGRLVMASAQRASQLFEPGPPDGSSSLAAAVVLTQLIQEINLALVQQKARRGFRESKSKRRSHLVELSREPVTEHVFWNGVAWLREVLCDCARAPSGAKEPLLPPTLAEHHFRSQIIQELAAGPEMPDSDQGRAAARARLVAEAITHLRSILRQVRETMCAPGPIPSTAVPEPSSFKFDVAISYAGPQREVARKLAELLCAGGARVFIDVMFNKELWGKNLTTEFERIYRRESKHCVIFVSREYVERKWTTFEGRSAIARAMDEQEYILPIQVEAVELPGLLPTVSYQTLSEQNPVEDIARLLLKKLGFLSG